MKKSVDPIPIHHGVLVRCTEDLCAGIALTGNNVAVFHQRKLACTSTYFDWEAINFVETDGRTEVRALCNRWGKQKRGQGSPNDREYGDSKRDGGDAAIQLARLANI